jgi:lauroyl/myristoyl acyltransferase
VERSNFHRDQWSSQACRCVSLNRAFARSTDIKRLTKPLLSADRHFKRLFGQHESWSAGHWSDLPMNNFRQELRRKATQIAIQQGIAAAAWSPIGIQRSVVCTLVELVGRIPAIRRRIRENIRLALNTEAPPEVERLYFQQVGWLLSNSLTTFHHGIAATPVADAVKFDGSVGILDKAVAEGRGVVLSVPHWCGHELVGAIINRRHPMTVLARQSHTPDGMARKKKWYSALGMETVFRPLGASKISDAVAYMNVLKKGKLLAITPDLLADSEHGTETFLFGRRARLHSGPVALAIAARAPMVRVSGRWQTDSSVLVVFDRAPIDFDSRNRDAAILDGIQNWCHWFEEKLRAHPENWLFWLDKRWSRYLRTASRTSAA